MARLKGLFIILVLVVCGYCFNVQAVAADFKNDFNRANELYKENKYEQAIVNYELIERAGYVSGNLYYNLGNCYFKKGDLGKAMLNYELAMAFIPGDSDLRSNYDYLRLMLNLPAENIAGNRLFKGIDKISQAVTIDGLTLFLMVLCWIFFLGAVIALFSLPLRRLLKPVLVGLAAIFLLGGFCLFRKVIQFKHTAIVLSRTAEVKFEPAPSATTYFKLIEGEKLQVLELSGGWYKIKRPDGKIGWIPESDLARLN